MSVRADFASEILIEAGSSISGATLRAGAAMT
jgi:hypothetical protein